MMNSVIERDLAEIYRSSIPWERLKNKTVLVAGAYGMLPSYMVYMLAYLNELTDSYQIQILAMGRNHEKMQRRFRELYKKKYFHPLIQDVCEPVEWNGKVDFIIHAAGLASPQYYKTDPVGTLMPNTIGTYQLLEFARRKQSEGFLLFSSGSVYGSVQGVEQITENVMGTLDPMDLRSCYGESKRMGETMCKAWAEQYGIPAFSVRIHHTYGPTMELRNDQRVFAEFTRNIVEDKNIVMKSDGSQIRSFCYISDAVVAFFLVLLCGEKGQAYNVANSKEFLTVAQLAELLVGLFPEKGLKVIRQERDSVENYMESKMIRIIPPGTEKLKMLGWSAKISAKEGFKRTVKSFMEEAE